MARIYKLLTGGVKSCPFCKRYDTINIATDIYAPLSVDAECYAYVKCIGCGAQGPTLQIKYTPNCPTEGDTVRVMALWNTRPV